MARGDYTVQEVEALKQAERDTSYRTCVLTMFIFLALCIILLVIAWTTWKPTNEKETYPHHSKYGDKRYTPNLDTEHPVTEPEQQTTMKTHLKEHKNITLSIHHPIRRTQSTATSATTERHLIRLVAFEPTETINTNKLSQTKPTTVKNPPTRQENYASTATTENFLKQQIILLSSAATSQKPLTHLERYAAITTTESPLIRLVEYTTTSTSPVTSLKLKQPLTTTIQKSLQVEETPDDKSVQMVLTSKQPVKYTTPYVDKFEQSELTTEVPVHWHLTTETPMSITEFPQTQHLLESKLKSSTAVDPLLKYKTTHAVHSTESTETKFTTEIPQPENQPTQQQLSTQTTDSVTRSTLRKVTESSVSWSTNIPVTESATSTTFLERDDISKHPKISTLKHLTSSSDSSDDETKNLPVNDLTTSTTVFTGSSSTVNNLSASTATNDNVTSHSSNATIKLTIIDRSTTPADVTTGTTDNLASSNSTGSHFQPVSIFVTSNASADSTTNSTITPVTDITDNLLSQSTTISQLKNISSVSTTRNVLIHSTVTGEKSAIANTTAATAGVTLSVMSTQYSPSGETSIPTPSDKSQKIIVNATIEPEKISHCTSSTCKVVASRMLSMMNHSADPCEDFYEYACGGLRDNRNLLQYDPQHEVWTRIASAVKRIGVHSSEAFQKFSNFYDQCLMYDSIMNKTSRLQEVRKVLDSVGKMYSHTGWAVGNLNLNLTSLLVKLFQLNSAPLFDVQLDVDVHNASRFLLKLTAPSHQSKFQSESTFVAQCKTQIVAQEKGNVNLKDVYRNKYLACTRDYGKYMNVTEKALKELGMFKDLEPFHEAQYIKDLRFFIEFEILHHLRELPSSGEMRHILLSKQFMSLSVDDLQAKYPLVDWKTLLSALVGDSVNLHTTVQLYFNTYFDSLFDKLSILFKTDNKNRMNMHNALLAMFAHDLYVDLVETQSPCNRKDYCLKVASGLLEDVSSALYLSTFTREQLNAMTLELQTLFTQLKIILQEQFKEAEWLDDFSRSYLTSKLQQLIPIADGGVAFLDNSYLLNEQLSEVNISSGSYLQNSVQLVRRYRSSMYSLYNTEPNVTNTIWSYFLLPYDTQALAIYQLNIVVIPFGLIGSPQSIPDLPDYIFKARVGNDLARQITHHFDITGIEYGTNGKDSNLLSDVTRYKYNTIKECDEMAYSFEKSWTNHKHEIFTYQVDPSQSMNERFADSSALQLSYKTFKRNAGSEPLLPWLDMNHDKLYHMLVAQELCTKGGMLDYTIQMFESEKMPPFLRVTNLVQNSELFAQAYSCGRGTQMNPEFKCNSFPELREVEGYDGSDLSPH